ncbi:trans-sulfuration enzyme family protein [Anaerospora hongkongensis]|uniref:trans-sulfuration enzyme family protein n=1 Tax=Anaerospora hongkongensis TaxID=244830 RepID=UPI00289809AD|nr:PLP-dependent aspartate aminotransferase family protein [Anaerospora hongkongensis]
MEFCSKVAHVGLCTDERTGAISTPVYQTATFRHPGLGQSTGFDYSRTQNPTRKVLEEAVADLENGAAGFAFSSGMAAVSGVLMIYSSGDHLVVVEDCYGGTYRILDKVFARFGITTTFVDSSDLAEITQAITGNTRAILVETPTNPLMKIADIRQIAQLARRHNLHCIVDNTFLTPYFQRPLELGADIVIHSGTKYLSGHNDVLCGIVVARDAELAEKIRFIQNATGAVLGPQDSWLLLRGMKTLALRMDRHNDNAGKVAEWLTTHPKVEQVYYPGLSSHPGRDIQESQASGYGGMLSFTVTDPALVPQVLAKVKLLQFAESLGGVESLITFPAAQTHADIPADIRARLGISDCLLRLSVGIEHVDDIIQDLEQALG